ncbi:MAG: hypothetical protein ABI200_00425 [Gaiellales bacterium]
MRSSPVKLVVSVVIFLVALGGALMLLRNSSPAEAPSGGSVSGGGAVATSEIWKLGDTWTVKVRQDAGAVSPDSTKNIASVPYRFQVDKAARGSDGAWIIKVMQDGAEGPFAKGWRLHYVDKGGVMTLHRVATGSEPPLEAELAAIVLGPQFPYELTYEAPPKNATLEAADLLERATLPPSTLPGKGDADAPGGTPPAKAPKLDDGAPATY